MIHPDIKAGIKAITKSARAISCSVLIAIVMLASNIALAQNYGTTGSTGYRPPTTTGTTNTYSTGSYNSQPATGYGTTGTTTTTTSAYGYGTLTPGKDWVKEKIKLDFLPVEAVKTYATQITTALRLTTGQITTINNLMLVYASPADIQEVKELITMLDTEPRHIIFEATLISVDTDRVKQIGNELVKSYTDSDSDKTHTITSTTDFGIVGSFENSVIWTFTQGANSFKLTAGYLLERGAAEVVSKPVLRVRDGGRGTFQIVTNVPQKTVSDRGTRIEYKPTGISITIQEANIIANPTPDLQWGDEGFISDLVWAKLKVTDGTIGIVTTEGITTNDTVVESEGYYVSGDTYILASLVKDTESYRKNVVPGLHKLPLVGNVFESKTNTIRHTETIILMRPTIEVSNTHELLASHFETSQDHLPIHLGGRNRDSINVHPFSDAKWKGVPEIYGNPKCSEGTYWALLDNYTDEDIATLSQMFKTVRNRVGLILGQSQDQIRMQVMEDEGLEQTVNEVLDNFAKVTGKKRPTAHEMLVAAAHEGVLAEWIFNIYKDRLGIHTGCEKRDKPTRKAAAESTPEPVKAESK